MQIYPLKKKKCYTHNESRFSLSRFDDVRHWIISSLVSQLTAKFESGALLSFLLILLNLKICFMLHLNFSTIRIFFLKNYFFQGFNLFRSTRHLVCFRENRPTNSPFSLSLSLSLSLLLTTFKMSDLYIMLFFLLSVWKRKDWEVNRFRLLLFFCPVCLKRELRICCICVRWTILLPTKKNVGNILCRCPLHWFPLVSWLFPHSCSFLLFLGRALCSKNC